MNIKEIEELTGVSKQNIRFYEKKNLLHPERNKENGYRIYTQTDVYKLKEILLYRKLGLTIEDIASIQQGNISVEECMSHYYHMASLQVNRLRQQLVIYENIQKDLVNGQALDIEKYTDKIQAMERKGITFFDVMSDYLKKAKDNIYQYTMPRHAMWFEPEKPILNKNDFVDELILFAQREKKNLNILHIGMEPIMEIEGKTYLAMLESPHRINLPKVLWLFQAFFNTYQYTFGFKFVYLYEVSFLNSDDNQPLSNSERAIHMKEVN
ncbi:MAG: MerR family transcriptional regulator [Lachnospiraceae bacterium]|nr:MerR family transcriptional regulator [Lachnospiraceae bacterium]